MESSKIEAAINALVDVANSAIYSGGDVDDAIYIAIGELVYMRGAL